MHYYYLYTNKFENNLKNTSFIEVKLLKIKLYFVQ